jgi:hypothetical protein
MRGRGTPKFQSPMTTPSERKVWDPQEERRRKIIHMNQNAYTIKGFYPRLYEWVWSTSESGVYGQHE